MNSWNKMESKTPLELEIALAYAASSIKGDEDHALLKHLLNEGIEKEPALVLMVSGSKLWNPKQQVTMETLRDGTIEHDYKPLTDAYKYFLGKGYSPITSAFLASGYMNNRSSSLKDFEERFSKSEESLMPLLE